MSALQPKQVTIGPVLIGPDETQQVSFQAPSVGRVKGAIVGEGARAVRLYVGKERFDVPPEGDWSVDLPVTNGQLVMLTVKNVSEEPGLFRVVFQLEVEGADASSPEGAQAPEGAQEPLSQKLPPDTTTTAADLGVRAGCNEIAAVFTRNEIQFLLESLRTGCSLFPDVKYSLIRRLDAVMKAPPPDLSTRRRR